MNNELTTVNINKTDITVKEYQGKRVVTLKEIDLCHERPEGTARRTFNANKQHLIEGVDYFVRNPSEAAEEFGVIAPNGLKLLTESGYLMLVKSFTDDLAWDVQRQLVNTYFRIDQKKADNDLKLQIQQEKTKAMLLNAQYRMLKLLMEKPEMQKLSPVAVETLQVKAMESITKANLGAYLPEVPKTYSASEIAKAFGVTAAKVGRLANTHGLKTEEYGVFVMDKSPYSSKEVPNFRYNEKGKNAIGKLLGKM